MGCGASADKVESAVSLVPGIRPTVSAPSTSLPTCTNEPDLAGFSQIREEDVVTRRLSEDATYGLKDPGDRARSAVSQKVRARAAEMGKKTGQTRLELVRERRDEQRHPLHFRRDRIHLGCGQQCGSLPGILTV
eukprot:s2172_g4.t1